jgi:hypothetical protein
MAPLRLVLLPWFPSRPEEIPLAVLGFGEHTLANDIVIIGALFPAGAEPS